TQLVVSFFFFQAEDGIRDRNVTGVQTCALPIWPPVGGRLLDTEPLALPDRETVHALVPPQLVTGVRIHHRSRPNADTCAEEGSGVTGRDEADVVTVGLGGYREPGGLSLGPDIGLKGVPEREQRMVQLPGGEHSQHVRLVLGVVDRPAENGPARAGRPLRLRQAGAAVRGPPAGR